jgi:hypothetical protein
LIDPWLDDSEQVDYHATFSEQRRTLTALATSIAGLEEMLISMSTTSIGDKRKKSTCIDAILISHPFTDHCHPGTLQSCPARIPFLVTSDTKSSIEMLLGGRKKLKEEKRTVYVLDKAEHNEAPAFPDEQKSRLLPCNVNIVQMLPRERFSILAGAASMAWSKLHGGILLLWKDPQFDTSTGTKTMIYTPHGIGPKSIPKWLSENGKHSECILTSLDKIVLPSWLSGVVNLGLSSAIDLIRQNVYKPRYILATHEERKEAKGLVARLIKRYWLGLETPDAKNEGLTQLKQKDENRQVEAQSLVDAAIGPKAVQVLVLDINQPLQL